MTEQGLHDLISDEERRLKVGDEEFRRRHQEIMARIWNAEKMDPVGGGLHRDPSKAE
ncbi:Uncharacterised protein [uncultured Clostridium sp.]|nr:Uncharacterised protein [uncultured Clostridium sp.]